MNKSMIGLVVVSLAGLVLGSCDLTDVSTSADNAGYAPDGTLAIYTPAGIKLYDSSLANEKRSILLDADPGGLPVDVPIAFDLAADGSVAAVGYSNTETHDVAVFSMADGTRRATIDVDMPPPPGAMFPVQGVVISAHGNLVYIQAPASGVFDVAAGTRLWGNDDAHWLRSPRFSADETTLYGASDGKLNAFDARTGEVKFSVDAGGSLMALALSPDGAALVSVRIACSEPSTIPGDCSAGGMRVQSYAIWSAADGTLLGQLPAFPGTGAVADRSRGGGLVCTAAGGGLCGVAANNGDQPLLLVFRLDGTLVQSIPGYVEGFSFSPDGQMVAIAGGSARVYRLDDGTLVGSRSYTYGVF